MKTYKKFKDSAKVDNSRIRKIKESPLIPTLRFFRRRRIGPSISSLKRLTRHERTHPYSSFPTTKGNVFVVLDDSLIERNGKRFARRATLFQSGSRTRQKLCRGIRFEDQRGTHTKYKNNRHTHSAFFTIQRVHDCQAGSKTNSFGEERVSRKEALVFQN